VTHFPASSIGIFALNDETFWDEGAPTKHGTTITDGARSNFLCARCGSARDAPAHSEPRSNRLTRLNAPVTHFPASSIATFALDDETFFDEPHPTSDILRQTLTIGLCTPDLQSGKAK
jgi:hypothetical protein